MIDPAVHVGLLLVRFSDLAGIVLQHAVHGSQKAFRCELGFFSYLDFTRSVQPARRTQCKQRRGLRLGGCWAATGLPSLLDGLQSVCALH